MMDNSGAVGFGDFCVSRVDDLVLAFRKSGFGFERGVGMMDNSSAVGFGDFCVSRLDDLVLAF